MLIILCLNVFIKNELRILINPARQTSSTPSVLNTSIIDFYNPTTVFSLNEDALANPICIDDNTLFYPYCQINMLFYDYHNLFYHHQQK